MYIEPNSIIELYRDLRLDNKYSNTMWFSSLAEQDNFFTSRYNFMFDNQSYQRKDRGVIRVEQTIGALFSVNYMRFRNTSFENKWFYAFVNRIEYVNNITCNVYYTIDVIQTYMFDWHLEQCLIERQHSTTDVAGDNLIPEGLVLGDYINDVNGIIWTPDTSQGYSYLVSLGCDLETYDYIANATTPQLCTRSVYAGTVNGLYSAIGYFICDTVVNPNVIKNLITYLQKENMIDAVISITMIPAELSLNSAPFSDDYSVTKAGSLDGYTPVNQKLLTYPYCILDIYNDQCEHQELRYELFSTTNCVFTLNTLLASTPEAILYVRNYNKANKNPDTSLSLSGFPQIPYYNDSYKAWQALNYDQMAVSRQITAQQVAYTQQGIGISQKQAELQTATTVTGSLIGAIGSAATGNFAGFAQSAVAGANAIQGYEYEKQRNELAGSKAEYENYALKLRQSADESRAKKLPNTPHAGSTSMAVATETKGFWYNKICIRRQFAERIDKYFTMFGYAQNIVGVPNIHARQYFTYVKTTGSCVTGLIPQDDRELIDTVFDRGIRFWTDYTHFEDYTVNNAII